MARAGNVEVSDDTVLLIGGGILLLTYLGGKKISDTIGGVVDSGRAVIGDIGQGVQNLGNKPGEVVNYLAHPVVTTPQTVTNGVTIGPGAHFQHVPTLPIPGIDFLTDRIVNPFIDWGNGQVDNSLTAAYEQSRAFALANPATPGWIDAAGVRHTGGR
jgi:hypothetical protein